MKRSLRHVGGPASSKGLSPWRERLEKACAVVDSEGETRRGLHGFHTYPGRMHPRLAENLIALLDLPVGKVVLDPFCGSGTVLIEAMVQGLTPVGIDLNPVAAMLARFKAQPWRPAEIALLMAAARAIGERMIGDGTSRRSGSRRNRTSSGADTLSRDGSGSEQAAQHGRPRGPSGEVRFYEPHIMAELSVLRAEILAHPDVALRPALMLVFSSLLVKLSRHLSDTRPELVKKSLGRGTVTRHFLGKAHELGEQLTELSHRLPKHPIAAKIIEADSRDLAKHLPPATVSAVVTSPPYRGMFDYAHHHQRRLAWLELDAAAFLKKEIGARRKQEREDPFRVDMARVLEACGQTLAAGGRLALVTEDGSETVAVAEKVGFSLLAEVVQDRPGGRREHVLLFYISRNR